MSNDINKLMSFLHKNPELIKREFNKIWATMEPDGSDLITIDVLIPLDINPVNVTLNFIGDNENTDDAIKLNKIIKQNKTGYTCFGNNLYFRISEQNSHFWIFRYTFKGDRVEYTMGRYPDISLVSATRKAKEYKQSIKNKIYPSELNK